MAGKRELVWPISGKTNGAILAGNAPLNNADKPTVRFSSVKTSGYASTDICQARSVFASVAVRDRIFFVERASASAVDRENAETTAASTP